MEPGAAANVAAAAAATAAAAAAARSGQLRPPGSAQATQDRSQAFVSVVERGRHLPLRHVPPRHEQRRVAPAPLWPITPDGADVPHGICRRDAAQASCAAAAAAAQSSPGCRVVVCGPAQAMGTPQQSSRYRRCNSAPARVDSSRARVEFRRVSRGSIPAPASRVRRACPTTPERPVGWVLRPPSPRSSRLVSTSRARSSPRLPPGASRRRRKRRRSPRGAIVADRRFPDTHRRRGRGGERRHGHGRCQRERSKLEEILRHGRQEAGNEAFNDASEWDPNFSDELLLDGEAALSTPHRRRPRRRVPRR